MPDLKRLLRPMKADRKPKSPEVTAVDLLEVSEGE